MKVKCVRVPPYNYDVRVDGKSIGGVQKQLFYGERDGERIWWGLIHDPVPPEVLTDYETANKWFSDHYTGNIDATRREAVASLLAYAEKKGGE